MEQPSRQVDKCKSKKVNANDFFCPLHNWVQWWMDECRNKKDNKSVMHEMGCAPLVGELNVRFLKQKGNVTWFCVHYVKLALYVPRVQQCFCAVLVNWKKSTHYFFSHNQHLFCGVLFVMYFYNSGRQTTHCFVIHSDSRDMEKENKRSTKCQGM